MFRPEMVSIPTMYAWYHLFDVNLLFIPIPIPLFKKNMIPVVGHMISIISIFTLLVIGLTINTRYVERKFTILIRLLFQVFDSDSKFRNRFMSDSKESHMCYSDCVSSKQTIKQYYCIVIKK